MALMEKKNLKKYFHVNGGMLHAVDDVTLSVEKGETIGIVGESGCGKSTLGKLLMRLETVTAGEIIYDGKDLTKLSERDFKPYRKRIQMIFQDPFASLDQRMTVAQLIAEPIRTLTRERDKRVISAKTGELMDMVGLAKRLENTYPHELDGGRRQRIGIARALASEPELIVCDEPVSALDVSIQAQVINLLQDLQKEKKLTYIFITHDLSVVKHISDKIAVMYLGQLVETSYTKELFANTLHPYTKALFSAIPIPDIDVKRERILLKGELTSPVNPKAGCRFAKRCPYAGEACIREDIHLKEYGQGHFAACCLLGKGQS